MKFFYLLLALPALLCLLGPNNRLFARAQEDELDADEAVVGSDDPAGGSASDDSDLGEISTSPYADTHLLFTRPLYQAGVQLDLPGGQPVEFVVGFLNKAEELDFFVDSVEASIRYPMDFNYVIQNFSAIAYNREVKPGHEATVSYAFLPADAFAGRPFGLNIQLNYHDSQGAQYFESIFNETITVSETTEGLDGETFFLYIFLVGGVVLLGVVGQQYLSGAAGKKKRGTAPRKVVEVGTSNNDVDYDWLPEEVKRQLQKSPKSAASSPKKSPSSGSSSQQQSPKSKPTSPRQRKGVRAGD